MPNNPNSLRSMELASVQKRCEVYGATTVRMTGDGWVNPVGYDKS